MSLGKNRKKAIEEFPGFEAESRVDDRPDARVQSSGGGEAPTPGELKLLRLAGVREEALELYDDGLADVVRGSVFPVFALRTGDIEIMLAASRMINALDRGEPAPGTEQFEELCRVKGRE